MTSTELATHLQPVVAQTPTGRSRLAGSGVLFAAGTRQVLLSAAHVLKADEGEQRYLIGGNGPINITDRAAIGSQESGDPWLDAFDVGFAELTREELEALSPSRHVSPAAMERGDEPTPGRSVVASGYPLSRAKVRHAYGALHYTPFVLHTAELPLAAYEDLGINPGLHIAIAYDRTNIARAGDTARLGVAPKGLSGGGIWRHDWENEIAGFGEPLLAGIIVGKSHLTDRVLVGTRVWALARALVAIFPDLAGHVHMRTDEDWTVTKTPLRTGELDR